MDLVAVIGDRLGGALLIVLCGKLVQDSHRLLVVRAVEQCRELGDAPVLQEPDGLGARTAAALWLNRIGRAVATVGKPVLAPLERIGRQIQLACLRPA